MSNITNAASFLLRATLSEAGRAKLSEAINVASHIAGRVGLEMSDTLLAQHTAFPGDPKAGMFSSVIKALQGLEAVRNVHIHDWGGAFELSRAAFGACKVEYERDPKMPNSMSFLGISDHLGNLLYHIGQRLANATAAAASQLGKNSGVAAQARDAFLSRVGFNYYAVRMAFQAAQQGGRVATPSVATPPATPQPTASTSAGPSSFADQPWEQSETPPPLPRRRNSAPNPNTFGNQPWEQSETPPPRPTRRDSAPNPNIFASQFWPQSETPKVESEEPLVDGGRVDDVPSAKSAAKPLYQHMGLMHDTSPDDIKKTYKKGVLKYHPDKNPNDPNAEERFKQFQNAYEILSNPVERFRYDQGQIDEQGHDIEPPISPFQPQGN
jgi:hypothetical protein